MGHSCGLSWADANDRCGRWCMGEATECPTGEMCFGDLPNCYNDAG